MRFLYMAIALSVFCSDLMMLHCLDLWAPDKQDIPWQLGHFLCSIGLSSSTGGIVFGLYYALSYKPMTVCRCRPCCLLALVPKVPVLKIVPSNKE